MQNKTQPLNGGIEGGGTKFVCAVGTGPNDIRALANFPTTTPQETMAQAVEFFKQQEVVHGKLASIGFGCFGPLDPNPDSKTYGYILPTPNPGWTTAHGVGRVQSSFDVRIAIETDVNDIVGSTDIRIIFRATKIKGSPF